MCEQKWLMVTPRNAHYLTRRECLESKVRSYPRKHTLAIASARGCVEGKSYLDCLVDAVSCAGTGQGTGVDAGN